MYDVIIIGAGPAGISASLYTTRANLKTLVLYSDLSALEKTNEIENYYGFDKKIDGKELYLRGIGQAKNIGADVRKEEVIKIEKIDEEFLVASSENSYQSTVVILATGNKKNKPKIKGIDTFEGKGISYCAVCDGFFYKNKNVCIIGSGPYAIAEANDLIPIVNHITILTNAEKPPEIRAENVSIDTKLIKEIQGDEKVRSIEFEDESKIEIDGIFIAQGVAGSIEFARKLGAIIKENAIVVNEKMETNIKGLYACGDCTGGLFQISKAVYEGMIAGLETIKFKQTNNN